MTHFVRVFINEDTDLTESLLEYDSVEKSNENLVYGLALESPLSETDADKWADTISDLLLSEGITDFDIEISMSEEESLAETKKITDRKILENWNKNVKPVLENNPGTYYMGAYVYAKKAEAAIKEHKRFVAQIKRPQTPVSRAIQEHVARSVPFRECIFRPGSNAFREFYREVRSMHAQGLLEMDWEDEELLETDIGEYVLIDGERVPLDVPFISEEQELDEESCGEKGVKPNSPKRGGSKKYYVYVNDPKTGNCKKVSWGDTTGLSTKAKNKGAVKSFVARHKCKQKNDKTKAGYWACRTPRYKSLGVKGGQWW